MNARRILLSAGLLVAVVVVSGTAGWLGAELHERSGDAPASPGADTGTRPAPSPTQSQPSGSALTSVTVRTVVGEAARSLEPGSVFKARLPAGVDAAAVQVSVAGRDGRAPSGSTRAPARWMRSR